MRPIQTICFFLLLACSLHCVDNNDYPMTMYRNATDLQFQVAASYDNYDAINEGSMAAAGGASAAVRAYGQQLVDDRRAAQAELRKIADSVNTPLPQAPAAGDSDLALKRLAGAGLDTAYLRETIQDQDSALRLYQQEVTGGSYVGLVAYANKYLPVIQRRRIQADSLLQVLNGH
jgi:putative membrane protein